VWALGWADDVTATLLALFEARPTEEGIELRWELGDPAAWTETWLERAMAAEGPWSQVRLEQSRDGATEVGLDRDIQPDRTDFYRVRGLTRAGEVVSLGSITAMAGERIAAWELGVPRPNPSRGATAIEFAVPRRTDLRL